MSRASLPLPALLITAASFLGLGDDVLAQSDLYKPRVPIRAIGNGIPPSVAERQRVFGNYSDCVVRGPKYYGGFATLVNKCDVAVYTTYCSVGDAAARSDCGKVLGSKIIDGQRTYGYFGVLGPGETEPVAIKDELKMIWLACDQGQGLAYLAGEPGSGMGYCGDGNRIPSPAPVGTRVWEESSASETGGRTAAVPGRPGAAVVESAPAPIAPHAAARGGASDADDIFASALAKSPEELKAEVAESQSRYAAAAAEADRAGRTEGVVALVGALAGGYVAARTGDTRLLEVATGQPLGSLAGNSALPGAPLGGAGAVSGSQACQQLSARFSSDASAAAASVRGMADSCRFMQDMVELGKRYRPQMVQACRGVPGFEEELRIFDQNVESQRRGLERCTGTGSPSGYSSSSPPPQHRAPTFGTPRVVAPSRPLPPPPLPGQ